MVFFVCAAMSRSNHLWSFTGLLLCSWFYCTLSTDDVQPKFLVRPVSVVAPLGSNATFQCSFINALNLTWNVNFERISSDILREKKILLLGPTTNGNTISSSLVVAASMDNDKTRIICIGFVHKLDSEAVYSDDAILTVYGRPEPPQNISAEPLAPLRLIITWLPPYSLPEVQVTYKVFVTDESTSEQHESGNIFENFHVFEGSRSSCDYYTISVLAVNDAGESNATQVEHVPLPTVPLVPVSDVSHAVQLHSVNVSAEFNVTVAQACPAYPVQYYSVTLAVNLATGETIQEESNSPVVTVAGLQENANYSYWVQAHNEVGAVTYNSGVLYTTDVQDPQLLSAAGKVIRVQCQYAVGSEAQGCFVTVSYPNGTQYMVANSTQGEAEIELSTPLPAHCYDVCVYDWEMDGTMGELAIPVNTAVWNDSCSSVTPPPTSESGSQTEDDLPIWLLVGIACAVGLIIVLAVVMALMCVAASARKGGKSISTAMPMEASNPGRYTSCANGENATTTITLEVDNTEAYETIPEVPIYEQIYEKQRVEERPIQDYTSLQRGNNPSFPLSSTENGGISLSAGRSEYSQLNELPQYHVLEHCRRPHSGEQGLVAL